MMEVILGLAGAAWIFSGLSILVSAKSAIHEILACLAVSFGVMFWGFAAVVGQLKRIVEQGKISASPAPMTRDVPIEEAISGVRGGPLKSRL